MASLSRVPKILPAAALLVLALSAGCSRSDDNGTGGASSSGSSVSSVREQRSSGSRRSQSSVSSKRASAAARSASSAKAASAPFFSLRKSSSSVARSSAAAASAKSSVQSSDAADAGSITLSIDTDRSEGRPGDVLFYTVTAKNTSDDTLEDVNIVYSFSQNQLSITEADGVLSPDRVQWTIDSLAPSQNRALRFRAQLGQDLAHGARVRGTAVATIAGVIQPDGAISEVRVINQLPTTGLGDGTRPLENTRRFLRPFSEPAAGSVVPAIVWAATILMGIALGASAAKRYL